jgi:hypothetical protein
MRRLSPLALFFVAVALPSVALPVACARRPEDPAVSMLVRTLQPGERLILARVLDPEAGEGIVAVVGAVGGKPELRIYEKRRGAYAVVHREQQGDLFRNLTLEDVNADGRDEILATWTGGHLETLEVISRGEDGAYTTLFQNAGREIEKRYGPAGTVEFWITSRTYEERPGQPATYDTTAYRWDGQKFAEAGGPPKPGP